MKGVSKIGQTIKQRSIESEIPYEEIDYQIVPLVDLLNRIGYKTQFSCWGHDKYDEIEVIFDEIVTDEQIDKLTKYILSKKSECTIWFYKWKRIYRGDIFENWMMKLTDSYGFEDENDIDKYRYYYDMLSILCGFTAKS